VKGFISWIVKIGSVLEILRLLV